jgi:hypothetical protein
LGLGPVIDAVLTPHPNELTCGTGKWSIRLAERLGVPCRRLPLFQAYDCPLISARLTELGDLSQCNISTDSTFDLVVHDWADGHEDLIHAARRVYAANPAIAEWVRTVRPDVQTIWCPSSLAGNPDRGQYRVLTYGMAHKITAPHYEHLHALLAHAHPHYTISLSTAVHEGSPWDESLQRSAAVLRDIFGDHLRVLGYLADDALAKELHDCDAVALFYDPALRSNNTTAWAALDAGKPLVTNLDEHSPTELLGRVINLPSVEHWPFQHVLRDCGTHGQQVAQAMSWEQLVGVLRA